MDVDISRFIIALFVMAGLFTLLVWGLKTWGSRFGILHQTHTQKRIHMKEVHHFDARTQMRIVQVDDIEYIVMLGAQGIQLLDQKKVEHKEEAIDA